MSKTAKIGLVSVSTKNEQEVVYVLHRMVTLSMTLMDPNCPKWPLFLCFGSTFISLERLKLGTLKLVSILVLTSTGACVIDDSQRGRVQGHVTALSLGNTVTDISDM